MEYLVTNFIVFGIFFLVITLVHYCTSKWNFYAKKLFKILLFVRLGIYLSLISNNSLLFFVIFLDLVLSVIYPLFSNNGHNSNMNYPPFPPTIKNCPKCKTLITPGDKFCGECGYNLIQFGVLATVEPIYLKSENEILDELIKQCANKNNYNIKATLPEMKTRKIIISVIFVIISIILTSLIFFHISPLFIPLVVINTIIYFIVINNFNTMKYLRKEIKSRPDEDYEYVVSNVLSNASTFKYSGIIYVSVIIMSIIIPLIVFSKPHYLYEYTKDGYYLRFYTTSYESEEHITIPETHKGKKVIGIRGNVFMNLKDLKSVTLPDTMEVIRGHAFDGDISLESINIPSSLTYLGGGAFKNCHKLKSITIPKGVTEIYGNTFENTSIESVVVPDTVINIGGSAFKDCENLKTVKLSKNIIEIHGNTFENCISLESIDIPDGVTRIGGHAFYNNESLSSVNFTENSKLEEIGSSAFRLCSSLNSITLPKSATIINERAFKESPTKVYYFGEVMYGNMIDKSKYENKSFAYLHVGEEFVIGKYYEDAICHNDKLILSNINVNQDKVVYSIEYIGANETKTFTIDSNTPYFNVNNDLAVEISSKYAATNPQSLSFNVYYN